LRIGVPKELKSHEYRVALTPSGAAQLVTRGHTVLVQRGAGEGSGFRDADYAAVGAILAEDPAAVWAADLVVKVKEPIAAEFVHLRPGLTLFTFLHLAAFAPLTGVLLEREVDGLAYETITDATGSLPLLRPMSEIAGRLAPQVGAQCLERSRAGKGLLLGGVPGTRRGRVAVIGGGVVGTAAARIAVGLGAKVTVLDVSARRMHQLEEIFGSAIETLDANAENVRTTVAEADLVIGAVLVPGGIAPKVLRREHVKSMTPGSVIVDVAVDQGGCAETTRATTHDAPTFVEHDVVHYCVANMPGAVPQTSTAALTNVTLPIVLRVAELGLRGAARLDPHLAAGINTFGGACVCEPVARAHGHAYSPLADVLAR